MTYRYAVIGLAVAVGLALVGASLIAALGHAVPSQLWTAATALVGGLLGVLIPSPQATSGYKKALAESKTAHNAASQAAQRQIDHVAPAQPGKNETPEEAAARIRATAQAAAKEVENPSHLSAAIAAASPKPGAGAACDALALRYEANAQKLTREAQAPGRAPARRDELAARASVFDAAAQAAQSQSTRQAAKAALSSTAAGIPDYVAKLGMPLVVGVLALYFGTQLTGNLPSHAELHFAVTLGKEGSEVTKHYLEALSSRQAALMKDGSQLVALGIAAIGAAVGVMAPSPGEHTAAGDSTSEGAAAS